MEQVKVCLALLSDEENGSNLYSSVMSDLLCRNGIELPSVDTQTQASVDLSLDLIKIANQTVRHMSIAKTWSFLMPISRYVRFTAENISSVDPLHRVNGFIHHIVRGPEIEFMTGYEEVLSIVRKVKVTGELAPLTILPENQVCEQNTNL